MAIEKWLQHHRDVIQEITDELELPEGTADLVYKLWNSARLKAPRVPKSLIIDCVYIVSHMTGNRRSITQMKNSANIVIGRRTKPFNQDRREENKIWINNDWARDIILSVIPDEDSYGELLNR